MKILICSLTYPLPNGVTSSINESVNGFLEEGHEIRILSPNYGLGRARPEHVYVSASTIGRVIQYIGKDERMFALGAGREIREIIHGFRPDAFWLHTVTWAPNAFERIMLKSRLPKVLTYHTMLDLYGKLYLGPLGEQQMIRRSSEVCNGVDQVITPSKMMARKLIKFGVTKPIAVIPTGIEPIRSGYSKKELAHRFNFSANHHLLISVGRVVKEKNVPALLKTLQDLIKLRSDITLLLVGPGEIQETKAEAERLGIGNNIAFTDQLSLEEARRCYKAADIFLFASQSETQGLAIGEAMSAGIPVVALDSPIRPEVYPNEVAASVKNPHQLAATVDELLKNPTKSDAIANAGKKFVAEQFSKKKMLQEQIRIFEKLLTK